jgi:RNA polymerase sigma factor (TIGR02999 family)
LSTSSKKDVTTLLVEWTNGSPTALEQLTPLVYEELRRLAARHFRRERPGHTLQSTALVHEAYMRMFDQRRVELHNRNEFFAFASKIMRNLLVNHARARSAAKRQGGATLLKFDESLGAVGRQDVDLIALDEAIDNLAKLDARQARIVELRFFAGLSIHDTADVLAVSSATVKRDWDLSRAWLYRRLDGGRSSGV